MASKNKVTITAEKGKQELFIERAFEAPRDLVFTAFSDPDILCQFLGPKEMTMKIVYFNFKSGGSYRYIHSHENGKEYAFHGVIHEVSFPGRIIQTFEFEQESAEGNVSLDTAEFKELLNNRTQLTIHSVFRSVAKRDMMILSGMERGFNEGFSALDLLLEKGL